MSDEKKTAGEPRTKPRGKPFQVGNKANPSGRPRKGESLAEAIRAKVPNDELVEFARKIMRDAKQKTSDRLQAHHWLADRGHGKAPQVVDVTMTPPAEETTIEWGEVPIEERQGLLVALAVADDLALPEKASEPGGEAS